MLLYNFVSYVGKKYLPTGVPRCAAASVLNCFPTNLQVYSHDLPASPRYQFKPFQKKGVVALQPMMKTMNVVRAYGNIGVDLL